MQELVRSSIKENDINLVDNSSSYSRSNIFTVIMYALGYVHCVGLSVSKMVTDLAAFDKWEQGIQENFEKDPRPVTLESEKLRQAI
jgi:hypothetical protein